MVRVVRHGVVDSTSERAFAALAGGTARDGDVHLARGQTAGRGRRGRRWESPEGLGLYLSWIHLPPAPAPPPATLTAAAGLAVHDALVGLGAAGLRLDWPNDVVADGAKLAGVLVESRGLDPRAPHYVIGIGIDVGQREFPPELAAERAVTSLALLGLDLEPEAVQGPLLDRLEERLRQAGATPEALARDYLAATGLGGSPVRVRCGAEEHRGVLAGLDLAGELVLETGAGSRLHLELAHVRAVEPAAPSI